jgi:ABC-type multidrug transport system fused ATPase/permease subunit
MQGKAMIVTAHRFSAIRDVDRIIVMDDGKVAEEGTHEQLIKADGLYAMLYNIQEKEGLIYEG